MTDYESPEFLIDGSVARTYEELSYHDKIKVKALEGLDKLAASLNSIANVQAIEFQINHLNNITAGFSDQMDAKDAEIQQLTTQLEGLEDAQADALAELQNTQAASRALMEAEIASLRAANESLTENFNKFKSVLTSIDHLTDEVID